MNHVSVISSFFWTLNSCSVQHVKAKVFIIKSNKLRIDFPHGEQYHFVNGKHFSKRSVTLKHDQGLATAIHFCAVRTEFIRNLKH